MVQFFMSTLDWKTANLRNKIRFKMPFTGHNIQFKYQIQVFFSFVLLRY
jgi:hypothetical protein